LGQVPDFEEASTRAAYLTASACEACPETVAVVLVEVDHYVNKKILVVGGGDSAVEAAMGLANQVGNKVTLCYRGAQFSRIKDRNYKRIEECMRSGKVEVLFETNPREFKPESVVLDVQGSVREIPNDYVWIFAGGIPPYDFLKKIGIRFGMHDLTMEASKEAKLPAGTSSTTTSLTGSFPRLTAMCRRAPDS
jgi:thioredoxin reductase